MNLCWDMIPKIWYISHVSVLSDTVNIRVEGTSKLIHQKDSPSCHCMLSPYASSLWAYQAVSNYFRLGLPHHTPLPCNHILMTGGCGLSIPGESGGGSEYPCLVEDIPAHGRGFGNE